jgi:tetratricopeptide (TPR) repeat protein
VGESEAASLLAAIDGLRIGHNSWLGMSLGPEADELVERALHADPQNPRAWLVRGTSLLFKPAMFGGDKDKALEAFQHAAELFEHAPPPANDSLAPVWGRAEAQAWIGQALRALGRDEEALAAYRRALEIAPDFGWVRDHLLPSLERKAATR